MNRKHNTIQIIPIEKLIAHPNNPNQMSQNTFAKLVRNIESTGMYEPIIVRNRNSVRDSNSDSDKYEIINGHHRVKALKQLGYETVEIIVWDVDDQQTNILLTTLNQLSGTDILEKKLALLKQLNKTMKANELSKILPLTAGQIERYHNLKLPKYPARPDPSSFTHPLVFFVTNKQKKTINQAIKVACDLSLAGKDNSQANKTKSKAAAITQIAESFIQNNAIS